MRGLGGANVCVKGGVIKGDLLLGKFIELMCSFVTGNFNLACSINRYSTEAKGILIFKSKILKWYISLIF